MKFKGILLLIVGLILNKSIAQNLIRNPQISPDASTIAFSYYGDIWVYNVNSKLSKRLNLLLLRTEKEIQMFLQRHFKVEFQNN